jgi:pimeloyl-ACP methyl ester carboxylesterase
MQKIFFILFLISLTNYVYSQDQTNYGSNAAAGNYYSVRGIRLYVEQYGQGKPLLLIHGNGGSISSMASIIPYFSKHYKVIAVDSRAQGKSKDDSDTLSFEMMADDNAALLNTLHLDSAYVIGWSDGGIVALELAMRHPDKVIKLASSGANLWPDSTAILPSLWKDDKKYYDSTHSKVFTTDKEKNDWKLFMLDWLQPNIPLSALQRIVCPALIISGDHDLIRLEHTLKIYQNIPKANLWIVPNSSHGTLIDHPDEFTKTVDDFFQKPYTHY